MKSFLRENPTLAFGLGLPLVLVVLFLIGSGVPSLLVPPPQYDVLYTTAYYNQQNTAQISVVGQEVQVIQKNYEKENQMPQLWRYNPTTGAVKEVSIIWLPIAEPTDNPQASNAPANQSRVIDVPALAGLKVDSSSIAPDGYEFRSNSTRSHNVFGGLFYSSRYNNEAVLVKDGRRVRLPERGGQYYYGNSEFIGWVITQ